MTDETLLTLSDEALVATGDGLHGAGSRRRMLAGRAITAIALDGPVIYALVDRTELHRIDGDRTDLVTRLANGGGSMLHVHQGSVWVGGDAAGLWRLDGSDLVPVESFLIAPTRSDWHTPWGGPPAIFSMVSHGDDLYVGVHVGGILRTDDDGQTWQATIDLNDDVHQVVVGPDGTLWAATGYRGLATSTDRGASWTYVTDGLHATYLLAVAATTDGVLVGASSGPRASDGALYRLVSDRFDRIGDPLPADLGGAIGPRQIAAAGDRAAVVTPDGALFTSADGGRRWERRLTDLPKPAGVALAR